MKFFIFLFLWTSPTSASFTKWLGWDKKSQAPLKTPLKNDSSLDLLYKQEKGEESFKVEILLKDLGIPWGMLFLNDKELLWTEKKGLIKKINISTRQVSSISLKIKNLYSKGQGGLLDVALHPDFQKTKWIYLSFSLSEGNTQTTALGRGQLLENKITDFQILFKAKNSYNSSRHFGSRLVFDKNNFLFMTVGDRAHKESAQNLSSHLGKLLRLDENGKALKDNPFVSHKKSQPEIYSYGHRNPQGLFIHPETQGIYLQEHGPKGGDEINLIQKGANYGWPVITHGRAYSGWKIGEGTHKKGMKQPIKYWTPSIAPSGFLIYSGKKFPKWKGDFFSGSLVLTHLNKLKISKNKEVREDRLLSEFNLRFRNVIEGPQGYIWASTDSGMILKISPL